MHQKQFSCSSLLSLLLFSTISFSTFSAAIKFFSLVSATLLLIACASNGKQWNPHDYTVKSGDTIYSIAWRYELDPVTFADWNNLSLSKGIRPGQRLHTRKPVNYSSSKSSSKGGNKTTTRYDKRYTNKKWIKVKKGDSLSLISSKSGVSVSRLAELNQLKKPFVIQPGQTIFLKPLTTASYSDATKKYKPKSSSTAKKEKTKPQAVALQSPKSPSAWPKSIRWRKPAKGKVIKKFNSARNDSKGIDISGNSGDSILASASGQVVYSGNGLISYGNLIIIKHNDTYLSAYAYNRRLLVKEGDTVKAGEKIAEMGRKDNKSPRLHFEIRKNGRPVDPLKYISGYKT